MLLSTPMKVGDEADLSATRGESEDSMKFHDGKHIVKFYDGKYVVKREVIDDVVIETFIEVKDGVVYLKTYINYVFNGETVIADLIGDQHE